MAIETEYLKESPNIDFIESCEDFLWEISATEEQKYVSVRDRYLKAIGQHTKVTTPIHSRNASTIGFAKRIALVCTAFVVLICLTQGAIRFRWFSQNSSSDAQQYIIQGHSITIDLITNSIAEHDQFDSIVTNSWDEFSQFLGFIPSIIAPSSLSASDTQYTAFIEADVIKLIIQYRFTSRSPTVLTIHHYIDAEEAHISFEQDKDGEQIEIDGVAVYRSTNIERNSFTWLCGATVYNIAGSLETDEYSRIIQELLGGLSDEN